MKNVMIATIPLVVMPALGLAQPAHVTMKQDSLTRNAITDPSGIIPISTMDQRKIYHWDNGQTATPSGRQAGDARAVYARVIGDSAIVVTDWAEKLKMAGNPSAKH